MQQTQVRSLGWEDLLEKGVTTHSSILACRISKIEEPGRLQSRESLGRHCVSMGVMTGGESERETDVVGGDCLLSP